MNKPECSPSLRDSSNQEDLKEKLNEMKLLIERQRQMQKELMEYPFELEGGEASESNRQQATPPRHYPSYSVMQNEPVASSRPPHFSREPNAGYQLPLDEEDPHFSGGSPEAAPHEAMQIRDEAEQPPKVGTPVPVHSQALPPNPEERKASVYDELAGREDNGEGIAPYQKPGGRDHSGSRPDAYNSLRQKSPKMMTSPTAANGGYSTQNPLASDPTLLPPSLARQNHRGVAQNGTHPLREKQGDEQKNVEALRNRIVELERREISQSMVDEEALMKKKQSDIQMAQEVKELRQHIQYLDQVITRKDQEAVQQHNKLMDTRYQLNQEIKKTADLETKIKKNQSQHLDQDRIILELQRNLDKEKAKTADLSKEIRDLKKAHLDEIEKISRSHKEKYKQLKGLIDQYRIQVCQFEKLAKHNEQLMVSRGFKDLQKSNIDLAHIDTERLQEEKQAVAAEHFEEAEETGPDSQGTSPRRGELYSEEKLHGYPQRRHVGYQNEKEGIKDILHFDNKANPFSREPLPKKKQRRGHDHSAYQPVEPEAHHAPEPKQNYEEQVAFYPPEEPAEESEPPYEEEPSPAASSSHKMQQKFQYQFSPGKKQQARRHYQQPKTIKMNYSRESKPIQSMKKQPQKSRSNSRKKRSQSPPSKSAHHHQKKHERNHHDEPVVEPYEERDSEEKRPKLTKADYISMNHQIRKKLKSPSKRNVFKSVYQSTICNSAERAKKLMASGGGRRRQTHSNEPVLVSSKKEKKHLEHSVEKVQQNFKNQGTFDFWGQAEQQQQRRAHSSQKFTHYHSVKLQNLAVERKAFHRKKSEFVAMNNPSEKPTLEQRFKPRSYVKPEGGNEHIYVADPHHHDNYEEHHEVTHDEGTLPGHYD